MHYKKKLLIAAAVAASFTMPGSLVTAHAYRGEYYANGHDRSVRDRKMPHRADRPENDGAAVVGVLGGGFIVYRLFLRSRGARYPGLFHNGGSYDAAVGRYHRTEESSVQRVPHYDDPSIGYFWGNPVDGTNVKSLWGTTKEE